MWEEVLTSLGAGSLGMLAFVALSSRRRLSCAVDKDMETKDLQAAREDENNPRSDEQKNQASHAQDNADTSDPATDRATTSATAASERAKIFTFDVKEDHDGELVDDDAFAPLWDKLARIKAGAEEELSEDDKYLIRVELARRERKTGRVGLDYLQQNMEHGEYAELQGFIDPSAPRTPLDRIFLLGILFMCFCALVALGVLLFFLYKALYKKDDQVINRFMQNWSRFSWSVVHYLRDEVLTNPNLDRLVQGAQSILAPSTSSPGTGQSVKNTNTDL
ncbi:unnamed protein product [Amoebophrya sp. A120]|nr:unnamed protein product [Amoebophrya sp. A120]|eukprot:GSA120T00011784001.1